MLSGALTGVLAHAGQPPAPHDLWTAWAFDPLLVVSLAGALWLHRRGRRRGRRPEDAWRDRAFTAAIVVLALALLSPLEALSAALASAHMVQHVLLILVAGPLLAYSSPGSTLLRGSPLPVRRAGGEVRRRLGLPASSLRLPSHPATVWLLHVGTLWIWHSAAAYDAALRSQPLHIVEHVTLLATAVLFWRVVVGARTARRVPEGLAVLLVFGASMSSVFLSVLLTFARDAWYVGYASTTSVWGLDPLADQQLAGVLMWVPAGAIYLGVALTLFLTWIGRTADHPWS